MLIGTDEFGNDFSTVPFALPEHPRVDSLWSDPEIDSCFFKGRIYH